MQMSFTPEEVAFRDEVRSFFSENTPEHTRRRVSGGLMTAEQDIVAWQKLLHARGWGAPSWPKEYGGTGWTPTQLLIFEREAARVDAPVQFPQGIEFIGPILFTYGSEEQKARYLPRILSAEDWWCEGYSEPNAGSDLASLTTRAVRDGDSYVLNGQKTWTSYAHHSNRMFLLARTDPNVPKQAGISLLLLDMDTPGVTVRPIISIDEEHHTNEVFLDNVRVPIDNLVGQEGAGWSYGKALLDRERGMTASLVLRLSEQLRRAREAAEAALTASGRLIDDPRVADRLAQLEIEVAAAEMIVLRSVADATAGADTHGLPSMVKIRWANLVQEITSFWVEAQGYGAAAFAPPAGDRLLASENLGAMAMLYARVASIYGGSNEVMHNILARGVLGLRMKAVAA